MTASAAALERAKAPSPFLLCLSRARRYMNRKPLQFCMYRLPAAFALHLAERRPGRRRVRRPAAPPLKQPPARHEGLGK
jgi:hypothetical protein